MYKVNLNELIEKYQLKKVNAVNCKRIYIRTPAINRPSLVLVDYFKHFYPERIQVIGSVEHAFIETMTKEQRAYIFDKLFSKKIPCIIICKNMKAQDEMLEAANRYLIPILQTEEDTSPFLADLIRWIMVKLAPQITMHGVLIDVYGEGVLITGESGIGKSETALELIKRGHRLVADDAVVIKKVSKQTLIGTSPELIRYLIELRGIGIIDVSKMFGFESVKLTQSIDLVIDLEHWDETKSYDRLGMDDNFIEILGNKIRCHTIPIRPGRNLAVICESAAVNHRQKKMGYDAALELSEKVKHSEDDVL